MNHSKADVVVIGAGPGGLGVALDLRRNAPQLRIVVIEKKDIGGDNVSSGAVASKSLLHLAKKYHGGDRSLASDKILAAVRAKVDEFQAELDELELQRLGIDVMKGDPVFVGRRKIIINDEQIKFKYAVIASGSKPKTLPVRGLDNDQVITVKEFFNLKKVPKKLLIVGAGRTGVELGVAVSMLGGHVTIINEHEVLLPYLNKEVRLRLEDSLRGLGIKIYHDARLSRVHDGLAHVEHAGSASKCGFDKLMFAVGREPNYPDELKKAHVKVRNEGIPTNLKHQTSNRHVFAIGDVASLSHFTHIANSDARDVVEFIIDRRSRFIHKPKPLVPALLFTDPEVATVGLSYKEATQAYRKRSVRKIVMPYWNNHRAKIEENGDGILTVVVKRNSGRILGAQLAGAHAAELLTPFCIAMQKGLSLPELGSVLLPYPTYSELIYDATDKFFN
jgi:pyruvate/2-oxoglutarate dehydrogenase complex dihydrolipoamide dehydrogenase (E3) component